MSAFSIFVTGGVTFFAVQQFFEIKFGYAVSDKLKDLFGFAKKEAKVAESKVESIKKAL